MTTRALRQHDIDLRPLGALTMPAPASAADEPCGVSLKCMTVAFILSAAFWGWWAWLVWGGR